MFKKLSPVVCLSLVVGCGPQGTPTTPGPTPQSSASNNVPTPAPAPTFTPLPTSTPLSLIESTPAPTLAPTPIPTLAPTAIPTDIPSTAPSPTAQPTATATSDIQVIGRTSFNGKVFDDEHTPLDGVRITARSLSDNVSFEETKYTSDGSYLFNNAPVGVQIEITASKDGHVTRHRVEVLKSNNTLDPSINRFDFGTGGGASSFGVDYNAISDKPEVIAVIPEPDATDVYPNGGSDPENSFVLKLTFSEPMDTDTVKYNIAIYSFNQTTLSVDTSGSATFEGNGNLNLVAGTPIWDQKAFNISWNGDQTEATFKFKEGLGLPTDRIASRVPTYRVVLDHDDGWIKDELGITRGEGEKKFKLTDDDFEASYTFSVRSDKEQPSLDSLNIETWESGGYSGDAIEVRFNESMIFYTLGPTIAGGMGGNVSQAAAANNSLSASDAAANYSITVTRAGETILDDVTWASLGGSVIFDANDSSHKTVLLKPPTASTDLFKPGDEITVKVANTVVDPAGNAISSSGSTATATAE